MNCKQCSETRIKGLKVSCCVDTWKDEVEPPKFNGLANDRQDRVYLGCFDDDDRIRDQTTGRLKPVDQALSSDVISLSIGEALAWYAYYIPLATDSQGNASELCRIAAKQFGQSNPTWIAKRKEPSRVPTKEPATAAASPSALAKEFLLLGGLIHIFLTPTEENALGWFAARHWKRGRRPTRQFVAHRVFQAALTRPVEISSWIQNVSHYRDAEGIVDDDAAFANLIRGRREYRRVL